MCRHRPYVVAVHVQLRSLRTFSKEDQGGGGAARRPLVACAIRALRARSRRGALAEPCAGERKRRPRAVPRSPRRRARDSEQRWWCRASHAPSPRPIWLPRHSSRTRPILQGVGAARQPDRCAHQAARRCSSGRDGVSCRAVEVASARSTRATGKAIAMMTTSPTIPRPPVPATGMALMSIDGRSELPTVHQTSRSPRRYTLPSLGVRDREGRAALYRRSSSSSRFPNGSSTNTRSKPSRGSSIIGGKPAARHRSASSDRSVTSSAGWAFPAG